MPPIKVKSGRTGKTYDMPWDQARDPSGDEVDKFIAGMEPPDPIQPVEKSFWERINTPLVNVNTKPLAEPLYQRAESGKPLNLFERGMRFLSGGVEDPRKEEMQLGAFTEGLGPAVSGMTSPFNVGLMGVGEISALAKAGLARYIPEFTELEKGVVAARASGNIDEAARLAKEMEVARISVARNIATQRVLGAVQAGAGAAMAGEAGYKGITEKDPSQILPFALGALGTHGGMRDVIPPKMPEPALIPKPPMPAEFTPVGEQPINPGRVEPLPNAVQPANAFEKILSETTSARPFKDTPTTELEALAKRSVKGAIQELNIRKNQPLTQTDLINADIVKQSVAKKAEPQFRELPGGDVELLNPGDVKLKTIQQMGYSIVGETDSGGMRLRKPVQNVEPVDSSYLHAPPEVKGDDWTIAAIRRDKNLTPEQRAEDLAQHKIQNRTETWKEIHRYEQATGLRHPSHSIYEKEFKEYDPFVKAEKNLKQEGRYAEPGKVRNNPDYIHGLKIDIATQAASRSKDPNAFGDTMKKLQGLSPEVIKEMHGDIVGSSSKGSESASYMKVPGVREGVVQGNFGETPPENLAMGGADERVLDVIGTSLYTKDRPSVAVKELLQNAVDERKITGQDTPIKISFRYGQHSPIGGKGNSISIKDYGRGLNQEQLYTVFSDVGKTGKGDVEGASGGFGFAKAAPFLGGDYMRVESVVMENGEKVKYFFEGRPGEFKKQKRGVPLSKEYITPDNDQPTGLRVDVWYPKSKSLYSAKELLRETVEGSPGEANIHMFDDYSDTGKHTDSFFKHGSKSPKFVGGTKNVEELKGKDIPKKVATLETPENTIDIHYEDAPGERTGYKQVILNNGLYVFSDSHGVSMHPIENLPERVIFNIKTKVEEGKEGYPFPANREGLSQEVKSQLSEWLTKNIDDLAEIRRLDKLQKTFDALQPAPGNKFVLLDSGERYTPAELNNIRRSPIINGIADEMGNILNKLGGHFKDDQAVTGLTAKFGFNIDEPGMGGVNIPSPKGTPGSAKYAILINPFSALSYSNNPREAAQRMVHIIMHEFTHNQARSEGAGFTWELSRTYTKFDLQDQINAANKIQKVIAPNGTDYAPELQKLLQEYTESRRRAATTEDILTRERKSEYITDKGQDSTAGSSKPNGERTTGIKLPPDLSGAKPTYNFGTIQYKPVFESDLDKAAFIIGNTRQRSARDADYLKFIMDNTGLSEGGARQYGQHVRAEIKKIITQPGQKSGSIKVPKIGPPKGNEPIRPTEPINTGSTAPTELRPVEPIGGGGGNGRIPPDVDRSGNEGNNGGRGVNYRPVEQIGGFMKSATTGWDLSAPLRQGRLLMHKKEFWTALKPMLEAARTPEGYERINQEINMHPKYADAKRAGISFTDIGDDLSQREEAIMSTLPSKIPGMIGGGYRASARAYTAFLNKLRMDSFASILDNAERAGYNVSNEKFQGDLARFINAATGRGSLGEFEGASRLLNVFMFSPKLLESRVHFMNPWNYVKAHPYVRKEMLKSLAMFTQSQLAILGLASLGGASVELDPRNANFGKFRIGNTRIDTTAGFGPLVKMMAQILSGKMISSTTGKMYDLKHPKFGGPNRLDAFMQTIVFGKESPLASFFQEWLRGQDFEGKPFEMPKAIVDRITPMLRQDLWDMYKENPKLLALAPFPFFGAGAQTYGPRTPKRKPMGAAH